MQKEDVLLALDDSMSTPVVTTNPTLAGIQNSVKDLQDKIFAQKEKIFKTRNSTFPHGELSEAVKKEIAVLRSLEQDLGQQRQASYVALESALQLSAFSSEFQGLEFPRAAVAQMRIPATVSPLKSFKVPSVAKKAPIDTQGIGNTSTNEPASWNTVLTAYSAAKKMRSNYEKSAANKAEQILQSSNSTSDKDEVLNLRRAMIMFDHKKKLSQEEQVLRQKVASRLKELDAKVVEQFK